MNWKKQIRRASRVLAVTSLSFFIASALLFGLVQTDWGIKELAGWVSRLDGELTFVPGRVSGVFPFRFELERLSIADTQGVWLEAHGITVHWSPLPLIKEGQICFKEFVTASMNFDRPPTLRDGNAGPLPSWIFAFRSDRFIIDRLAAGKELLGEPAVLKLEARIPLASRSQGFEASLRIDRMDRVGSLLRAELTVHSETRLLKMEISFDEDRNGFFGKALGVEGPLSLSLSGEGTPDLWQGKLLTGVLPFGRLAADLEVKDAENPLIKMRGQFHPTLEAMPSFIRIWMDRELPFELETRLRWPKALVVELFALQTGEVDLLLKGDLDLNQRSSAGQFRLTCRDLKPLGKILDLPTAGTLASQGTFSANDKTLRFSVTGSAENFQVGDSVKVLGKSVSWELRAEGSPAEVFSVKHLKVSAQNLLLEGSGEMRIPEFGATMDTLFEIKDIQTLSSLESFAGWSTRGNANLSWNAASGALSSRFQGKLKPSSGVTAPFLAKEIDYAGALSLGNEMILNLEHLEVIAPWGKLQGKGKAHFPQQSLEATWHLLLPDLDPFSIPFKGGPLEVRGTVQGPVKALTLSAETAARGLSVSGFHVDTGQASLRAEIGAATKGSVQADAQVKELALRGHADFDLSNQHLNLKAIFLEGGTSTLTGGLRFFLDTSLVEGELKAECSDLSALSPLIHEKVQGSAGVKARLLPSEEGQRVSLLINAKNLESPVGKALRSRMEAHATLLGTVPRGRLTIEIQNGIIDGVTLTSSTLTLEGDPENASFQIGAEGHYKDPFEIKASGMLTMSSTEERVTLNHLDGHYGGTALSLLKPATLVRSSERINLGEWLFKLGPGQIHGSGYVRSTDVSLDLRFEGVPLELIPVHEIQALGGLASGSARLGGNPASPEGTAQLQIETLRFRDQGLPSAGLTVMASLRDNFAEATLLVQGLSKDPLKAHLESPFYFSLSPPALAFSSRGEIRGTLRGEIDLENISGLLGLHEEILTGTLELDLAIEGPGERPRVGGKIDLRKGSYENLKTGTLLKEIEALMTAQTTRIVLDRATASDGEGGRISAQGWLEVFPRQGFPFKADLSVEKAKPFRYNWGMAAVSADMSLVGSFFEARMTGAIRVESADFRIPDRLPPEIADLKVIEINKPEGLPAAAAKASAPSVWPLSLDLTITSPGRVFLSGRGLNTEWEGEVRVQGTALRPAVTGSLSVVKGHADFLGKRFEVKKGVLFLSGSTPPSPTIDMQAESKSRDVTVRLSLTGPVQAPEIKLSSDPPFPPDEILARLLFGRSASNITPVQALQLADSLNTLTRGGGLDLLARTRQLLGLDQLSLTQSGKNQEKTTLSAGKYLSEGVYLEVQQGISPETGKASLKWEITPNVSVQTEVGVNAEAGVGINWRWDY